MKRPDGTLVALEVHYLPPNVPPGHIAWDLQPGSTMTNANVEAIVATAGKRELTLKYKDGEQKILVPEGIPISHVGSGQPRGPRRRRVRVRRRPGLPGR
jgi:hypothetical protein